jgi:hypothetical protein
MCSPVGWYYLTGKRIVYAFVVEEKTSTLKFETDNSSKWLPYKPPHVADSASNRNEYKEYFLRVKAAGT